MTHPHRWLRAAHKIAPNGALFHDASYYRLGCKEGSRPLPTNNRKASSYWKSTYFRQVCRGRIYASRGVYPLGRFAGMAATGGIYAAPTNHPGIFILVYGRGLGIPRPYRAIIFCPVGRGDPTPPGKLVLAAKQQGGVKTPPYK